MTVRDPVAEAVREAHCERGEAPHKCVGSVTIDARGMTLSCALCGTDAPGPDNPPADIRYLARDVVRAVGLDWDALTADRQWAAVRALGTAACPWCHRMRDDSAAVYWRCACGATWSDHGGWHPSATD